ncbi:hypothetical protein STEG23_013450 [Scotinomys teguina]
MQSLIRNETLDTSTLQILPVLLWYELFMEASTQRKTKMIEALVADWPDSYLPVRLLMRNPNLEIYQAILAGVDTWLPRRLYPRQNLQEVDLRNVQAGRDDGDRSTETLPEQQVAAGLPQHTLRRRLEIFTALHLPPDEYQTMFLEWAEKRKSSVHLCCVKLRIGTVSGYSVKKVFKLLQPEFIQELELNTVCNLYTLASFVPFISKMSNLHKIMLVRVFKGRTATDRDEKYVPKIISLFSKLSCLKHVTIDDVYFLNEHMKQLLGCLKNPLESLSISLCKLSQSDLESFAQWGYRQLKHLYFRSVDLCDLDFRPLKVFLENVAGTLLTLELEDCRMKDPDLRVLLPSLSQCSLLTSINLYDNEISTNALKELLYHTANLSQLTKELYPAPKEVYDRYGYIIVEEFSQCCAELKDAHVTVRQLRSVCFGSNPCYDCGQRYVYGLQTTLCDCSL